MNLKDFIRDIHDYPKPGIVFKDLSPLWKDKKALKTSVKLLAKEFKHKKVDAIAGIESRGFIVGAALAFEYGVGFIPIRKPGKLPYKKIAESYDLEYGSDSVEIHVDAIEKGQHILLIDDLIATGGTSLAATRLIEHLGGVVEGIGYIVELAFLNARKDLARYDVRSLVVYE